MVMVQINFIKNLKRLRYDNGKEYINRQINKLCDENGIAVKYTLPYSSESNGKRDESCYIRENKMFNQSV